MSKLQAYLLRYLYNDYKHPSVKQCEILSREIGLSKKVIQMWFQDAQIRERKFRTGGTTNAGGSSAEQERQPEECKICPATYSHKYTLQDRSPLR